MNFNAEIWFVRHGEAVNNAAGLVTGGIDDELTERGREQSRALGRYLREKLAFRPDRIVTSQMVRAKQTLAEMGYGSGAEELAGLNETDAGSVARWTRAEFDRIYSDFWSPFDPARCFPDGESHDALYRRANACVDGLCEQSSGKRILMVAHGGTISVMLHRYYAIPMKYFSRFPVDNASVSILRLGAVSEPPEMVALNLRPL